MSSNRKPFYIASLVLLLDIISKGFIQRELPKSSFYYFWYPYGGIGVFENFFGVQFAIIHATNTGAAWEMLSNYPLFLLAIRLILILGIFVYLLFFNKVTKSTIPLSLILAGAIGNVIDIFFYGHVIDMFAFNFWGYRYPVFNIADSAIFIGVTWLLIQSFQKCPQCRQI